MKKEEQRGGVGRSLTFCLLHFSTLNFFACLPSVAADKPEKSDQPVKAAGIMIDKGNDWLTLKADGDDEPVKYVVDPANKSLQEAFKTVFNASRVQLTYKQTGDTRQLVTVKRQIMKTTGTMTGEVVKVYNDFWVEVKPKRGVADAFAPGGDNYNDKAFMQRLKDLEPGDSVTITYTTDFERHRIKTLRKNPRKPKKDTGSGPAPNPI